MKSNIVKSFREHEKRQKSQWMRDVKNYAVDLKKTFGRIIENRLKETEIDILGVIQLLIERSYSIIMHYFYTNVL